MIKMVTDDYPFFLCPFLSLALIGSFLVSLFSLLNKNVLIYHLFYTLHGLQQRGHHLKTNRKDTLIIDGQELLKNTSISWMHS